MKLFRDFKIIECKCYRDVCNEWTTDLECEFYLANPETFKLFGKTFVVDRIVIENSFCGLNHSYTQIEDMVFKLATAENDRFEYVEVPNEYLLEIAEIFRHLEKSKDKRLNDCILSDNIYDYLEDNNDR